MRQEVACGCQPGGPSRRADCVIDRLIATPPSAARTPSARGCSRRERTGGGAPADGADRVSSSQAWCRLAAATSTPDNTGVGTVEATANRSVPRAGRGRSAAGGFPGGPSCASERACVQASSVECSQSFYRGKNCRSERPFGGDDMNQKRGREPRPEDRRASCFTRMFRKRPFLPR